MTGRKKIHFATIAAGAGHVSPALAVQEALELEFPGKYDIRLLDFMKDLGCVEEDSLHKEVWRFLLAHPVLTKSVQALDPLTGPLTMEMYRRRGGEFLRRTEQYLRQERPDLIFSTHYFNSQALARVRPAAGVPATLVNCHTELFSVNSYWSFGLEPVDFYLVTSEAARRQLLLRGFPERKLRLFPYPLRASFLQQRDGREDTLRAFGLEPARKTLLVTLGAEGIGPLEKLLSPLAESGLPLNVPVVCGRNEGLRERLLGRYAGGRWPRILPLGYLPELSRLLAAADFYFTKPGPASVWEAVALRKPLLLAGSAHLLENPNIRFVVDRGLGVYVGWEPKKLLRGVRAMLDDGGLARFQQSYGQLRVENGAVPMARFLDAVLEGGPSGGEPPEEPPRPPTPRAR
jgi:UDP-N-acetylglucosamine:LPS N-acetylglucosamine transferase